MTVHWQSAKWIDVQLDYVGRNISAPYRVFAALNGIDDPQARTLFHFAEDLQGTHAEKLNELAQIAMAQSDPSDVLLFLDGDAFPVRPLHPWITEILGSYRLAAVRRDENLGDPQPHPSFCITTVATWRDLEGDWRGGGTWLDPDGNQRTDVGGTLLHQLDDAGIDWLPLLRTNTHNSHPVWFAVYAHRIYHHGAGFHQGPRKRRSRADRHRRTMLKPSSDRPSVGTLRMKVMHDPRSLLRVRPRHIRVAQEAIRRSMALRREAHGKQRLELDDERVFRRLTHDPSFYREFDNTDVTDP